MRRKTSPRTKAVLIFMGFLVLLPFIAVFAAVLPHNTASAPPRHVATAPVQHAQHAEPLLRKYSRLRIPSFPRA